MAEYEHLFKVIDEVQKTFGVREMMPKDIKREFLAAPRKFDDIVEKLEIIINEMTADDGPVPKNLGTVGTHDARTMQRDHDASNDMSYDDALCDRVERIQSWQRSRQERTERSRNVASRKRS